MAHEYCSTWRCFQSLSGSQVVSTLRFGAPALPAVTTNRPRVPSQQLESVVTCVGGAGGSLRLLGFVFPLALPSVHDLRVCPPSMCTQQAAVSGAARLQPPHGTAHGQEVTGWLLTGKRGTRTHEDVKLLVITAWYGEGQSTSTAGGTKADKSKASHLSRWDKLFFPGSLRCASARMCNESGNSGIARIFSSPRAWQYVEARLRRVEQGNPLAYSRSLHRRHKVEYNQVSRLSLHLKHQHARCLSPCKRSHCCLQVKAQAQF